jgi:hypothetical protein
MSSFPEFRAAMRDWLVAGLPLLSPSDVYLTGYFWVDGNQQGTRQTRNVLGWLKLDGLKSVPEWKRLVASAWAEPVIAAQIDSLVGTAIGGAVRVTLDMLCEHVMSVFSPVSTPGGYAAPPFDEELFDKQYAALEAYLDSDTVVFEKTIVLNGISIEEGVQLEPGLALIRIPDDDPVVRINNMPIASAPTVSPFGAPVFGIRWEATYAKLVGEAALANPDLPAERIRQWQAEKVELDRKAQTFLQSASIVKPVSAQVVALTSRCTAFPRFGVGFQPLQGSNPFIFTDTRFDASEVQQMVRFWAVVSAANKTLRFGLRRFSFAMARSRPEDRIIDCMIAGEALFLDPANTQELRYRFALRGAWFSETDPRERRKVFDFLRKAYDVRSAIAHGGQPKPGTLSIQGKRLSIAEFSVHIEAWLRAVLRAALLDEAKRLPRSWEDEIIGPQ